MANTPHKMASRQALLIRSPGKKNSPISVDQLNDIECILNEKLTKFMDVFQYKYFRRCKKKKNGLIVLFSVCQIVYLQKMGEKKLNLIVIFCLNLFMIFESLRFPNNLNYIFLLY